MKKTYIQPAVSVVKMGEEMLPLCGSVTTSGDKQTNKVLSTDRPAAWTDIWDGGAEPQTDPQK